MRTLVLELAPVLRLARVSAGIGAVAGVWVTTLWTKAMPGEPGTEAILTTPLWVLLGGGVLAGAGLYGFGAGLNDLLDAHRDRILRPNRPIVGGSLPPEAAVSVVALSLVLAVLGATAFGTASVLATLVLAVAVLVFNALGKFVPGIGMVLLSVIYAGHMLVPNLGVGFLFPAWWVMTHAMVIAGLSHTLGRKSPAISKRAAGFALGGWIACTAALTWLALERQGGTVWPSWVPWTTALWLLAAVAVLALQIARRWRSQGAGPRLGEKIARYGAFWPAVYGFAWFMGVGAWTYAAIMGVLILIGAGAITVLREMYALAEHPAGYRL